MVFLETLRAQGPSYDLLASQCKLIETPIFLDLCWGKGLDFKTITNDPGIEIHKGSRRFVLMRIAGELRYYAGPSDPYDSEAKSEVGVFPSITSALAFAHAYLIRGCDYAVASTKSWPRLPR